MLVNLFIVNLFIIPLVLGQVDVTWQLSFYSKALCFPNGESEMWENCYLAKLPLDKYDQKELTPFDLIAIQIIYKTNCATLTSTFADSHLQFFSFVFMDTTHELFYIHKWYPKGKLSEPLSQGISKCWKTIALAFMRLSYPLLKIRHDIRKISALGGRRSFLSVSHWNVHVF